MKFKYNYVSRALKGDKWEFRLLRNAKINTGDRMYESFSDVDYGGKKKAHKAALAFSDKTLSNLSKRVKDRLRSGYPKFKVKSGVYLVTRHGVPYAYLATIYNKFTGSMARRTRFFGGSIRTKEQAFKLVKKFRQEQVKIVQQLAIKYGYK